jgi:hypothetical protein
MKIKKSEAIEESQLLQILAGAGIKPKLPSHDGGDDGCDCFSEDCSGGTTTDVDGC